MSRFVSLKISAPIDASIVSFFTENEIDYSISKFLIGNESIVDAIITITPAILSTLGPILLALAQKDKFLSFKYKDMEIKNVKPEEIEGIIKKLNDLFKDEDNNL